MTEAIFIFFVHDQDAATDFYREVLGNEPRLRVPGMTEFELADGAVLGLMPRSGIARLLGEDVFAAPALSPRSELYLRVDDPESYHRRAIAAGGSEVDGLKSRDWGDVAAYSLDRDGHLLAFASADAHNAKSA